MTDRAVFLSDLDHAGLPPDVRDALLEILDDADMQLSIARKEATDLRASLEAARAHLHDLLRRVSARAGAGLHESR